VARHALFGCSLALLITIGYATMDSGLLVRSLKIAGCLVWAYTILKVVKGLQEHRALTKQSKAGLREPG